MRIESIRLRNYGVFRDAEMKGIPPLAVLVGANGTGKSTLLDAFAFLKDALTHNVAQAVARRGCFQDLVSRGESGPIGITVKFRESSGRLVAYQLDVGGLNGIPIVERESLRYAGGPGPRKLLDFRRGKGVTVVEGDAPQEQRNLKDPSDLAIKGLGVFEQFRIVEEFRGLLESSHISDFRVHEARARAEAGFAQHLSARGDNVAQVTRYLHERHRGQFDDVLRILRARVPGVESVEAKRTDDGRLVLRFQDSAFRDPFPARYVSDGTIQLFAYLILLHDPNPHPLLVVEDPETHLDPSLLRELSEEFRDYARRGGQVFVSSHSPDFLNGMELSDIYWLAKKRGFATVRRASESQLLRDLCAAGDLPGTLWKQRLFDGAYPQ